MIVCERLWRPPAPAGWRDQLAALDAGWDARLAAGDAEGVALDLRRLAWARLDGRDQLKLGSLLRRRDLGPLAHFRPFTLGLVAARTVSPLAEAVEVSGLARGLAVTTVDAGYDQIAAFAHDEKGAFGGTSIDAVLVLLAPESLSPGGALLDPAAEQRRLAAAEDLLRTLTSAARRKAGAPAIFATLPEALADSDGGIVGSEARFLRRLNTLIEDGAARGEWLAWNMAGLAAQVGLDRWRDPVRYHQAKTPFAIELAPVAADDLCALIAAMSGQSARAAVLDLDNTLWGGVIGDDGMEGLRLGQGDPEGEAYVAFQRYVAGLRGRGIVLAVCSKNSEDVALEPFSRHPDMVLRPEDIAVFQANWTDKAANLPQIAEALGLGLGSIAFIDDNPAERARVRQAWPQVQVPEIGEEPALFAAHIAASGVFVQTALNADDLVRADSYKARAALAPAGDLADYGAHLRSLDMRLKVSPFDEISRPRIVQLINKSNQFNLTGQRRTDEAVRRLEDEPGCIGFQARLSDVHGDHGIIAVVILRAEGEAFVIDTWVQSCRVLRRGVEDALINEVASAARAAGGARLVGEFRPSGRNGLVEDFYPRLGFTPLGEGAGGARRFGCELSSWTMREHPLAVES